MNDRQSTPSLIHRILRWVLWGLGILVVLITFVPLIDTNIWWVRALDFPRVQIAIGAGAVLIAAWFFAGRARLVLVLMAAVACGYQLWRVYPYTVLADAELELAGEHPDAIRLLSVNVLMQNDRYDDLARVIDAYDPHVLLLMETDQTWVDAMAPTLSRYPTVLSEPLGNHYGLIFATRLQADDARVVYLTESETPSVFASLQGPDGTMFRFVGLHPRPPVPGVDTQERDAQIYYAARFARKEGTPLIAAGDFNDVAWSDTSQSFKHVGQYLDPRIGRGFYSSFDANRSWLRFPIDQIFVTADVAVTSIERLGYFGSDHFPMAATVRLDADLAAQLNTAPEPVSDSEWETINASIERTRARLDHDDLTKP